MDLSDMKISGVNKVSVADSFNAPMLQLKIKNNVNTLIPNSNDIKIMITDENKIVKTVIYHLSEPLRRIEQVSDEFIIVPTIEKNVIKMKSYVKRYIKNNGILNKPLEENLVYQSISFSKGNNILETNYQDATLELVYPKESDMNLYFLNQSLYVEQKDNPKTEELYFKDAFTKVENKLNLEVNQIKTDCLVSKNNKFSLDELGNLSVNKITTAVPIEAEVKLLSVYPVGSIYISVNNTNPGNVFGGSWQSFGAGRTLVGFDSSQPEFDTIKKTGGEMKHQLTIAEMPSHAHAITFYPYDVNGGGFPQGQSKSPVNGYNYNSNNTGGNIPHENMPPYITVYMWLRIS